MYDILCLFCFRLDADGATSEFMEDPTSKTAGGAPAEETADAAHLHGNGPASKFVGPPPPPDLYFDLDIAPTMVEGNRIIGDLLPAVDLIAPEVGLIAPDTPPTPRGNNAGTGTLARCLETPPTIERVSPEERRPTSIDSAIDEWLTEYDPVSPALTPVSLTPRASGEWLETSASREWLASSSASRERLDSAARLLRSAERQQTAARAL